jgi:hypothetical protein
MTRLKRFLPDTRLYLVHYRNLRYPADLFPVAGDPMIAMETPSIAKSSFAERNDSREGETKTST